MDWLEWGQKLNGLVRVGHSLSFHSCEIKSAFNSLTDFIAVKEGIGKKGKKSNQRFDLFLFFFKTGVNGFGLC